jgi:hypothetical protein
MPTTEARIPTDRASRYIDQLCRHLDQMSRMRHRTPTGHGGRRPPPVQQVDRSDTSGTIRFTHGTCTLHAAHGAPMLRVDADDEDALRQLQDGITRRLETIGRRDHLTVQWHRSDPAADPPPGQDTPPGRDGTPTAAAPAGTTAARRPQTLGPHRLGRTLTLTAVAVLAILVHVGLLGSTLATSAWANWGTNIILAIILAKIIALGVQLLLRRTAHRRGRPFHRREPSRTESTDPGRPTHHPHQHAS